jgi:hypothetical protein|tara:strand:+ start:1815 stop:2048 length:234 start_codon:yes stop_codon:yes gene_type:complete
MKKQLSDLLKEDSGKLSSTRLAFMAWSLIVLATWAIVSYQSGELIKLDNSIVSILGVLMSGKVVQRFGEKPKEESSN